MGVIQIARLVGLGVVGAMLAALFWLAADRGHQKAIADDAAACESAAISPTESLERCGSNVRARVASDRRTIVCENALLPALRPETRFAASQSCDPGTRRLIAVADAQAQQIAGLDAALAKAGADTAAAITRAEARGRTETTRRNNAQKLIQAAPRGPDGGIACDADCLRQLSN